VRLEIFISIFISTGIKHGNLQYEVRIDELSIVSSQFTYIVCRMTVNPTNDIFVAVFGHLQPEICISLIIVSA